MDQKALDRLTGLLAVQLAGLVLASFFLVVGSKCYQFPQVIGQLPIDPFKVLYAAIGVTLAVTLITQPGLQGVRTLVNLAVKAINCLRRDKIPELAPQQLRRWQLGLLPTMRCLAFFDLIGIWACIRQTGGIEGSIFTPFLLILPTIIILIESSTIWEILFWATCCLVVFGMSLDPFFGFHHLDGKIRVHHILLMVSTGVCTFFPFLFLSTSRIKNPCLACNGTGISPTSESPKTLTKA